MAKGHREFTCPCVCVSVCLCVPTSCPTHNFIVHGGICVARKNHVSRSKVKVTVGT